MYDIGSKKRWNPIQFVWKEKDCTNLALVYTNPYKMIFVTTFTT